MRPPNAIRALVWIIAIAMFGVRLGGIHLHLCFDGQEPSASLHVEHEDGHEDFHSSGAPHQDQDVDLLAQAFLKKAGLDQLDVLGGTFVLATMLPAPVRLEPLSFASIPPTGPPRFLLPPLRGPPA